MEQVEIKRIHSASLLVRTDNSSKQNKSIRELVLSIKEHGLIQPITIRPVDSGFEVVAGHRRLKACRLLRWKRIPCTIRSLSDKTAFEIQLIENIQRQSLDPIEEAESFKKYVLDYGWGGTSHLAKIISKSEQYVSSRIQMLRLPKDILDEVSQKNLTLSHAVELVNLDERDQRILKDVIINEGLTVRSVREIASNKQYQQIKEYFERSPSPTNKTLMTKIKILKKTLVVFRTSMSNIDGMIEEANNSLGSKERVEFVGVLMKYRIQIHSIIDECIKSVNELKRKL